MHVAAIPRKMVLRRLEDGCRAVQTIELPYFSLIRLDGIDGDMGAIA